MATPIGILVIHGMGKQEPGFSQEIQAEITHRLGGSAARFVWQEIFWGHALQVRENKLWEDMGRAREPDGSRIPLDWQSIREFVVHNFGDALAYHRDHGKDSAYVRIHEIVSQKIAALKAALADPAAPVVVMAHSLGAHIMSNYLWDQQAKNAEATGFEDLPTLAAMITFGCNIPLFSLAFDKATPIDVPGKGIKKAELIAAARWLNFVDRDDVLGWPLRPIYEHSGATLNAAEKRTIDRLEDYEINVGGFATAWNPVAHGAYWTDDDFTAPVTDYLLKLAQAADA